MNKILIIEDEESILMPLEDNLKLEGYEIASARDGQQGLSMAQKDPRPHRPRHHAAEAGRIRGLQAPAPGPGDDADPDADRQEPGDRQGARAGARSRRLYDQAVQPPGASGPDQSHPPEGPGAARGIESCRFGDVEIDFDKYEAKKNGRPVPFTSLEFALLHFLVQNRGRVVHRDEVLDNVWGKDVYVDARTVDKHISLLRKKFEDDPQDPKYILGVRGIGYKFAG